MRPQPPAAAIAESVHAKERVLAEREQELQAAHSELERIQGEIETKLKEVEQRAEMLAQHEIRLLRREHGTLSRSAAALNAIALVGRAPAIGTKPTGGSEGPVSESDIEVLLKQLDALSERSSALQAENTRLRDEVAHVRTEVDAARRDAVEAHPTIVHKPGKKRTTLLLLAREIRRDPVHVTMAVLVVLLAGGVGYLAGGQSAGPHTTEVATAPSAPVEATETIPRRRARTPAETSVAVEVPVAPRQKVSSPSLAPIAELAPPSEPAKADKKSSGRRSGHARSSQREASVSRHADGPDAQTAAAPGASKRLAEVTDEARKHDRDLLNCLSSAGAGTYKLSLGFSVDAAGRTSGAKAQRTGAAAFPKTASCIERVIAGWRFSPGEAVTVSAMTVSVRVP